jgi:hypothetical protein
MAKAKKTKIVRKRKSKTKMKRPIVRRAAPKRKRKPVRGITGKIGSAVNVAVKTAKETIDMRRKMHADQPEE